MGSKADRGLGGFFAGDGRGVDVWGDVLNYGRGGRVGCCDPVVC